MSTSQRPSTIYKWFTWPGVVATVLMAAGVISLTLKAGDILSFVAAATASFGGATTTLYLSPYSNQETRIGEVSDIDINLNTRVPINAIGATISFPTDLIEVAGFSKQKSFLDLWTEETAIREDVGEVHFSGGTITHGGMTGTGTVLTLTIKPKHSGHAILSFKESEIYPNDGKGKIIENETRSLSIDIPAESTAQVQSQQSPKIATNNSSENSVQRTPDVNTDGVTNLVDVSIMIMRLVMPYDYHFDMNNDGAINVADVSTVLAATH